jgi:hypothetical protein
LITGVAAVLVAMVASAGSCFESDFGIRLTGHWFAAEFFARDWAACGVLVWLLVCVASIIAATVALFQQRLARWSLYLLLACYAVSALFAYFAVDFAGSAR